MVNDILGILDMMTHHDAKSACDAFYAGVQFDYIQEQSSEILQAKQYTCMKMQLS